MDAAFGHLEWVDVIVNNSGYAIFGAAGYTDRQIVFPTSTPLLKSSKARLLVLRISTKASLRLIWSVSHALRHDLARILIQRACLGN